MKKRGSVDWATTVEGSAKYRAAREQAQAEANADGMDRGIERNDLFREFRVFMLPRRENRCGHEMRCEVVSAERMSAQQVGHGGR